MKDLRLGSVLGVRLRVDWSWIVLAVLVVLVLAVPVLTWLQPEWPARVRLTVAVVFVVLSLASIVGHELAHAWTARRLGLPVRRIHLFRFGAAARYERLAPAPRVAAWAALAGPAASLVLAGLFAFLARMAAARLELPGFGASASPLNFTPLALPFTWLAWLNLALGLFNLLPAYPLDGFRLVQAALWQATGRFRRATRWALRLSQVVAGLSFLAGVAVLLGLRLPGVPVSGVGGFALAVLGWWFNRAALARYRRLALADRLAGVPVAELMRTDVPAVTPHMRLSRLVQQYFIRIDSRAFPVLENDRLVGLVSADDMQRVPYAQWPERTVRDIMTPISHLDLLRPDEDAADACAKLLPREVPDLPVVEAGRLRGTLRFRDITWWLNAQTHRDSAKASAR